MTASCLRLAVQRRCVRLFRAVFSAWKREPSLPQGALRQCEVMLRAIRSFDRAHFTPGDTKGIVFSMDRAMQLHALLGSYRDHASSAPPVTVIYRVSSEQHEIAYREVIREFSDIVETAVKQDTREQFRGLVIDVMRRSQAKLFFFLVDDNIFIEPVDISEFASHSTAFSIPTLRLGENLEKSYTMNKVQSKPPLIEFAEPVAAGSRTCSDLLAWRWCDGELDWGYPLSVDGHFFQREEFLAMVEATEFDSPNTFEGNLQLFNSAYQWRIGICYRKSRLVNIPYNRVQSDIENIHGDVHQGYLLEKWNEGYRIDRFAYYGMTNESAHQEMPLRLTRM